MTDRPARYMAGQRQVPRRIPWPSRHHGRGRAKPGGSRSTARWRVSSAIYHSRLQRPADPVVERHQEMDSHKPSGKSRTVPDRIADVPAGAKRRLTDHYGPGIQDWLRDIPVVIAKLAYRWRIAVSGYHDAGWTLVVAAGRDDAGRPVIIKVLSETERFQEERDALAHWAGAGVCRLVAADDAAQALLIEPVTEPPGGAARPPACRCSSTRTRRSAPQHSTGRSGASITCQRRVSPSESNYAVSTRPAI